MKKRVLFFARDYQADLFPLLRSDNYESIYVTLTIKEKKRVEVNGEKVHACFEELYDTIVPEPISETYFLTSFAADRYLGYLPLKERIIILGKEIAFWKEILDKYQPLAVVNETVAIEMAEIMHIEASKRGIKYLSWMSFPVPNRFYWQYSPMHNVQSPDIFRIDPSAVDIKMAAEYIAKVEAGAGTPFYAQNLKSRKNLITLLKFVVRWGGSLITSTKYNKAKNLAIFGCPQKILKTRIQLYFTSFFLKYQRLEDYKNYKLVFYPLHFEPEATLRYMSEFYANQVANIENIAKCLKTNQILVVKEHPQQPGMLLTKRFNSIRKSFSNIVFLPAEYPTSKLIKEATAIITLTSTAGFEGLISGKPVFVLGRVFYNQCPGASKISSFDDLREQLHANEYPKPSKQDITRFIAQMIHYTQPGNPFMHSTVFQKENIASIVAAIEKQI